LPAIIVAAQPAIVVVAAQTTPKGVKSYVLQYRVGGGAARRKTIGIHGSPWTTQTARKEAERLLMVVKQGVDPVEEQREAQRKEKTLNFTAYCDQFVELYLQPHWPDTWPEAMRTLENVVKPRWGKRSLLSLKRSDMVKLMDDYADRPGRKKYVHSLLRKLFNWAVDREDIMVSPLAGMKAPKSAASRRRVLGQEELICLWLACEKVGWPWGPYCRLLILTMQRRQEVAEMDWSEIDLEAKVWTLPADRAKNDEAHIVPLTDLVVDQLKALGPKASGLVFTTTGKTAVSGFSKAKRALDDEMQSIMHKRQVEREGGHEPVGIPEWRLHDIRRTGATNLQALGIPIEVTEAVLNHISGTRSGVAGIYNRHRYDIEKRSALTLWDAHLTKLLGPISGPSIEHITGLVGAPTSHLDQIEL
ncbi:MAG TPA: site-specific integrase, partial [Novosphingobium sp.]|nr:site-specific integrase [Novosphingobium sp.]